MEKIRISDQLRALLIEEIHKVEEKAKIIEREADEAVRTLKAWKDLNRYIELGWPFHIVEMLSREGKIFKNENVPNHAIGTAIDEISTVVRENAINIQKRFPWVMEADCKKAGIPIDPTSRHPRYSFVDDFFQLEIDEHRWKARLSDNEGKLAEFPADIGAIISIVQREKERIFKRQYNPKKFLEKLRKQYLAIVNKQSRKDGDFIPIRQITNRLGKNIKGFRTDEFLLDLSRLLEYGENVIDGHKLDLQQTKDTEQGMLLHGAGVRGYIGFIGFKEA